ncbi:MAG: pyruvate kinase [Actinomycetota bacterium]
MKIKILCTLGPSSFRPEVIRGLEQRGVDLFRLNLSHTEVEEVEPLVELIRKHSSTPICLDTEGAQVRCGRMAEGVELRKGTRVHLTSELIEGTSRSFSLWPSSAFETLTVGNRVSVDFDGALLRVTEAGEGRAEAEVVNGGRVGSNRSVDIDPPPVLPPLTVKDRAAIETGARLGITHYALSFASSSENVDLIRRLAPPGAFIISKIESRLGVRNIEDIATRSDAVLVDRGDLSREIPLEYVPYYQRVIVRQANQASRPVYVATNLLESMVTSRRPTVAEANDIASTLSDGVHGLVLAAETAIGIDPLRSVDVIRRAIKAFQRSSLADLLDEDRTKTGRSSSA